LTPADVASTIESGAPPGEKLLRFELATQERLDLVQYLKSL